MNGIIILFDSCYNCVVQNSYFDHEQVYPDTSITDPPVNILTVNSNNIKIDGNVIVVPSNDTPSFANTNGKGVQSVQSANVMVSNNKFIIQNALCTPMYMSLSNGLSIFGNLFYGFGNPNNLGGTGTSYYPCISLYSCEVFDVHSNVIDGISKGWCGISPMNLQANGITHQHIRNNVFMLNDEDGTCAVSYLMGERAPDIQIINNIVTSRTSNNKSYGFDVKLEIADAVIDYNDFYNINRDREVRDYGYTAWIHESGPYTIRENPEILTIINPTVNPATIWGSFTTSATSNLRGSGLDGTIIGLNVSTNFYDVEDSVFINTDLQKVGIQYNAPGMYSAVFFNSVFTQSQAAMNSYYGVEKYKDGEDYYNNQFGFVCTYDTGYAALVPPFAKHDRFYGKDSKFVINNRKELWPFDGITCPANPGRNYPTYPGYTTGLFGNPRATWANECGDLPCIIYDSIGDPRIIQDSISDINIIQNAIKPPCEG